MTNTPDRQQTTRELLWPVYEFRPLPDALRGPVRRCADGRWLEDDGKTYDLAFISGWGAPICMGIEIPYQRNIIWSWYDKHWGAFEHRHPRGNAWHYALRPGTREWGGSWPNRDQHPNMIAHRSGMQELVRMHGCANGRAIDISQPDRHILAGSVRRRDTREVLTPPEGACCMYCGDVWTPDGTKTRADLEYESWL